MKKLRTQTGFTLVELLVVIAIVAIATAFVLPDYVASRRTAQFKEAARNISSTLRQARANAINHNLEYRVVFSMANNTYQLQRGNSSNGSSTWTPVYEDWSIVQPAVRLSAPSDCTDTAADPDRAIHFNPNGTSTILYICLMDGGSHMFKVGVTSPTTGRVQITQ